MHQDETWHAGRSRPWPHCVRWGPSSPSPKGAQPQFSVHICCGQMAAWIKMSLGMEVGLGPGDFVLDEDPALPPQPPKIIFGPCLLRPSGWMDEAGTWHGGRPQPRRLCVRWGPSPCPKRGGASSPILGPFLLWPNGWLDEDTAWYGSRPRPSPHVRRGPAPAPQRGAPPNFWPMSIVARWPDGSRCHLARR